MKSDNYCILCTDKNLQKKSMKVWLTLFKDGNNFENSKNKWTTHIWIGNNWQT